MENVIRSLSDEIIFSNIDFEKILSDKSVQFSEEFIREHHLQLVKYVPKIWERISNQNLSDDFLIEFQDKIYWTNVLRRQVSEKVIEACCDKFDQHDWSVLTRYQNLSKGFIERFSDKVNWVYVCAYQNISASFISEHIMSYANEYNKENMALYVLDNPYLSHQEQMEICKIIKSC